MIDLIKISLPVGEIINIISYVALWAAGWMPGDALVHLPKIISSTCCYEIVVYSLTANYF